MDPVVAVAYAVITVALLGFPILAGLLVSRMAAKTADEVEARHKAERDLDRASILSLQAEIKLLGEERERAKLANKGQVAAAQHIGSADDVDLWGGMLHSSDGSAEPGSGAPEPS